jgi:hypothetical protein
MALSVIVDPLPSLTLAGDDTRGLVGTHNKPVI